MELDVWKHWEICERDAHSMQFLFILDKNTCRLFVPKICAHFFLLFSLGALGTPGQLLPFPLCPFRSVDNKISA